ncbi:hypothetical protein UYO_2699 [Lachnospiraceae bacterium JC7]|nr:hypothetical protein UYO_2699 [Lachnospiraceae bacterium JC7]
MVHEIKTVRLYELDKQNSGHRILVDRIWPRGFRKETLEPFIWMKDMAPSTELRKWFNHDPERFPEFAKRYKEELDGYPQAGKLREVISKMLEEGDVLLIYSSKDKNMNQAVVLKEWLEYSVFK